MFFFKDLDVFCLYFHEILVQLGPCFFVLQGISELSLDASTSQVLDDAFADELQEHL